MVLELRGFRVARLGGGDRGPDRNRRVQAGGVLDDLRARVLEQSDDGAEGSSHVVVDRRESQVLGDDDPKGARVRRRRVDAAGFKAVAIARMPRGERLERQPGVGHRARERAIRHQGLPALRAWLARNQPEGRLEADDAAERRRDADRPASVARPARADRGRRPPPRAPPPEDPPGRAVQIPWVAGAAVHGRLRDPEVAELRRRRLGKDHGPRSFEPFDRRRGLARHEVHQRARSRRRGHPGEVVGVLDGDRHATQRSTGPACEGGVGGRRRRARPIVEPYGERVDRRREAIRPVQHGLEHLDGGHLPASERSAKLGLPRLGTRRSSRPASLVAPQPAIGAVPNGDARGW